METTLSSLRLSGGARFSGLRPWVEAVCCWPSTSIR